MGTMHSCLPCLPCSITVPIGQGQFSIVNRGIWHDSTGMIYEVAVKSLAPGSPEEEQIKFLQEAAIMGQFSHPNVLQLYGVVVVHDCQLVNNIAC